MVDTETVLALLRRAGHVMMQMPGVGAAPYSTIALDPVDDPRLAYGYTPVEVNRMRPSAHDISMMDFVCEWLSFIPNERYVLRKIVAHRMLWDPDRDRSIWSYRRLGQKLHISHQAVKNWDEQAVEMIRKEIGRRKACERKISLYTDEFVAPTNRYSGSSSG